jgi:hypothetical protein
MLPVDRSCNASLKPDLRRAINQLQFWCSHSEYFRSTDHTICDYLEAELLDWGVFGADQLHRQAVQHTDLASFVDGEMIHAEGMEVGPRFWAASYFSLCALQTLTLNDVPSADDELGHTIIFGATSHGKERMMADDAMQLSRGGVQGVAGDSHAFILSTTLTRRDVVKSRSQISDALNALIPSSAAQPLATVLDYEPWIRHMVGIDDMHELNGSEPRTTRRLRRVTRSRQGSYERYLNLSTEHLELLRLLPSRS